MTAIPWFTPRMTGGELAAVKSVLDSGFINDGPVTREFERRIASRVQRQYGVAVTSGTAAIALALMACDAAGSDVIVPDLTYIASANAVRLAGANVILADVDPNTFCLTPDTIEAVRTSNTRFVLVVEVNGRCPDYVAMTRYCYVHDLTLITDSCEALGSCDPHGVPLGKFGLASCFSFSPNKLVTTGQGGMVVTDSGRMFRRLLELKQQGLQQRGDGGRAAHDSVGFNFKFTDIQASIGLAQLDVLSDRVARCWERDIWYRYHLGNLFEFPESRINLWADVMMYHPFRPILAALDEAKIGVRNFWYPLHTQRPYFSAKKYPGSSQISARGLWLPSSYDITREQVQQVAECIRKAMANGRP